MQFEFNESKTQQEHKIKAMESNINHLNKLIVKLDDTVVELNKAIE